MRNPRRSPWLVLVVALLSWLLLPAVAMAGPRSGSSFGGRVGFRAPGGSTMPRSYSGGGYNGYGGGGSHFFFLPGWGWGGGYGYGGGMGLLGTLMLVAVVGIAAVSISRAVRRYRQGGTSPFSGGWGSGDDGEEAVALDRAYVYKIQVGLGRSARGIQDRLESFAASGDTNTEAGLAALLQQTALELLREKDSIRYAGVDAGGPMSLTNAETRLNSLTLGERARFQVERLRVADGQVRRSTAAAEEGREALEYVVVTLLVATRSPLSSAQPVHGIEELGALLTELGGLAPNGILGLEVIWTPADPNDSMTETDVMTTYPDLRSM